MPNSLCKSASIVDKTLFQNTLSEMLGKFSHIHYDKKAQKNFYYGGRKLPNDCVEFENINNQKIVKEYIPILRPLIKGNSNWARMCNSPILATSIFKFMCKALIGEPLETKCARYYKHNTYMINKFYLPNNLFHKID